MPLAQLHAVVPRVERYHRIVEELRASAPRPMRVSELAAALGVSGRSIERDIHHLREAGLPIVSMSGPRGGYVLRLSRSSTHLDLTIGEAAILMASLVAMGPLASATAQSALDKLVAALEPSQPPRD